MNQQQKKFAVSRIYGILCIKAFKITKEGTPLVATYNAFSWPTKQQVATAIRAGKLILRKNIDISNIEICSNSTNIGSLYDLSPLDAKRTAFNKKHKLYMHPYGAQSPTTKEVYLDNPITSDKQSFGAYNLESTKRINAMQQALLEATDSIILGSDEEAISAISAMEKRVF